MKNLWRKIKVGDVVTLKGDSLGSPQKWEVLAIDERPPRMLLIQETAEAHEPIDWPADRIASIVDY